MKENDIFKFHENKYLGERYQTFQRSYILEHQSSVSSADYPLVFAKTNSSNISKYFYWHCYKQIPWYVGDNWQIRHVTNTLYFLNVEMGLSFMISHRYYHRKSGHVIKLFINDESVPAIDINSIISEEAFHIRFNGNGQDKGKVNIRAPRTGSRTVRPEAHRHGIKRIQQQKCNLLWMANGIK